MLLLRTPGAKSLLQFLPYAFIYILKLFHGVCGQDQLVLFHGESAEARVSGARVLVTQGRGEARREGRKD